jgi:hypothetical protein
MITTGRCPIYLKGGVYSWALRRSACQVPDSKSRVCPGAGKPLIQDIAMVKERPILFPEPQVMEVGEGRVLLSSEDKNNSVIVYSGTDDDLSTRAIELIRESISNSTGGYGPEVVSKRPCCSCTEGAVIISLTVLPEGSLFGENVENGDQGYSLEVKEDEISIKAETTVGLFYAAQTFKQLLTLEGSGLYFPVIKINDWPQFKYRGLFVESKWGPDLMTLDDWKEAIDYLASLKMNFMGVGIYGCWCIQYDNKITEFLTVPIKKYPQLKTHKVIKYYSPRKGQEEAVDYLPAMVTEDSFGDVIAYGKKRGVVVRPQFNSLGHNTLIPRTFPEVSSKDADGNPKNYGFCISNPKTYELLFDLYDEIIDKYLLPNGVDHFHLGMDEIYPLVGIIPENPQKAVDPWCECPECSKASKEELLVDFLFKITTHVKDKGINNITIWNDQLARHMNILGPELAEQIKERGLSDKLILNWWWYSTKVPETIRPELGLRTFVCPMPGYYFWMNYQSYLVNIYRMLKLGYEQGSEGTEAYCTFDYSFHRNYFCLAEYSWNQKETGELEDFREKYIQGVFGDKADVARSAFDSFDKVVEPGGLGGLANASLVYYRYSYVDRNKEYPRDYPGEAFGRLKQDIEASRNSLKTCLNEISKAREGFEELKASGAGEERLIDHYLVECQRYEVLMDAYLRLLDLEEKYNEAGSLLTTDKVAAESLLNEICGEARDILDSQDGLMANVEKVKSSYLLPHTMRELTMFRDFLVDLDEFLGKVAGAVKAGEMSEIPALEYGRGLKKYL